MSALNASEVISLVAHELNVLEPSLGSEWPMTGEGIAAHVVSKLADAGHSIVPKRDIVRIYRAASTLGPQYMMPTHFGADLEEAERWFALQQKMLDGLPGVDTVRLEYQDMWVTPWEPLDAAADEGEKP